ncbi:MAG: DUF2617 family protein [Planctomycetota bacterium]
MLSVRPKIAELVLQLYGRSLHPELFEVYSSKHIQRGEVVPPPGLDTPLHAANTLAASREAKGYEANVQITSAGHVVTWRHGGLTLTEVCTSSHQPLPLKRRLMSHRLEGDRHDRVECRGGVTYETSFALETVTPEAFQVYQQEFDLMSLQGSALPADDKESNALLHRFEASGRVGVKLGAVSFVDVQSRDRSLRVRALHTFPDDCAIVKTESVFRLPG